MRADRSRRDVGTIVLSLGFLALGTWMFVQSLTMSKLGAVFPRTIAVVMVLCALGLLVQRILRPSGAPLEGEGGSTVRRLLLVALLIGWVALIPVLGFFVASVIGFLALLAVAEYDSWTRRKAAIYGLTAVVVVGAFYVLFDRLLLVPLPSGLLF